MRVALIGLHNDKNLGDPIITESFEYLYRQFQQGDSLVRIDIDAFDKINNLLYRILIKIGGMFNISPWGIYKTQAQKYYQNRLKNIDFIVFTGGGILKYEGQFFYGVEAALSVSDELGIPVAFNSVGVEGYDDKNKKCRSLKESLKHKSLKYISTRDDYETLRCHYIISDVFTEKVADPAVWISQRYGLNKDANSKLIGIGVADYSLFTRYKTTITKERIKDFYLSTIERLLILGYCVELFTNGLYTDNDCAKEIRDILLQKGHNLNLRIPSDCETLVKTIASYRGIIATRMHSCIVAYSLEVPAIGVVWNKKLSLFGENIGARDCYLSDDEINPNTAIERLLSAIDSGYNQDIRTEFMDSIKKGVYHITQLIHE